MEITTGTGIFCPECKKEVTITTSGLLGGFLKQLIIGKFTNAIKTKPKGTTITGNCGHTFFYTPQPSKPS